MSNAIATANGASDAALVMERVIAAGDLARLSPQDRVMYYGEVCRSLGLNPLTKPFDYITLNSKLTLYATKGAADQLRSLRNITIRIVDQQTLDDVYVVTVEGTDKAGRADTEIGAVSIAGLRGEAKANALMKAVTKAKRRLTLSMCGLGLLDETEVETAPSARPVRVDPETGEIDPARPVAQLQPQPQQRPEPAAPRQPNPRAMGALHAAVGDAAKRNGGGLTGTAPHDCAHDLAAAKYGVGSLKDLTDAQMGELTEAVGRMDAAALDGAWQWARANLARRGEPQPEPLDAEFVEREMPLDAATAPGRRHWED